MIELGLVGMMALVWGGFVAGYLVASMCAIARDDAQEWEDVRAELEQREAALQRRKSGKP